VSALYGIAYNIQVNPLFIKQGTLKHTPISGWMGDPASNAFSLSKSFEAQGIVENAIVRFDHADQSGFGKIGELEFVIDPDYPVIDTMNISIIYCNAVDASGQNLTFITFDSSVIVYPLSTSLNELSDAVIMLFPNPAKDLVFISAPEPSNVEIMNMQGQLLFAAEIGNHFTRIDISGFAKGMYIIKAKTQKEFAIKKFIKE
jgi:hypothetical protein